MNSLTGTHQTKEHIAKRSLALIGKHLSAEHRLKISQIQTGRKQKQETIDKRMITLNKVRKEKKENGINFISAEGIERIRQSKIGKARPPEVREKLRQASLGHKESDSTKEKKRDSTKISWDKLDKEARDNRLAGIKNWMNNPIYKEQRSNLSKRRWDNPEYRDYITRETRKSAHIKPNQIELWLQSLLKENYPEYEYTGDGSIIIGGCSPDFTNTNGQKKVILLHGIYWHLWLPQKRNPDLKKEQVESKDIEHYKRYGFDTLIIWEDEKDNPKSVLEKIKAFDILNHKLDNQVKIS